MLEAAEQLIVHSLEGGEPCDPGGLAGTVETAGPGLVLRRLALALDLDEAETGLVALLLTAALSERAARALEVQSHSGGRGVPFWLAQRLVHRLEPSIVAASAPLVRFGLVEVDGECLRVASLLRLCESMLDRLCGASVREAEITSRIAPVPVALPLRNPVLMKRLATLLALRGPDRLSPLVLAAESDLQTLGANLAGLGLQPFVVNSSDIPADPDQRDRLARYWSRDAAIDRAALVLLIDEASAHAGIEFAERVAGHVIIAGTLPAARFRRSFRPLDESECVGADDRWRRVLGSARSAKLGRGIARVANHFRLNPGEIDAVCARAAEEVDLARDGETAAKALWHVASRAALTAPVAGVKIVEPAYQWNDLVLPPAIESALRKLESHVRFATTVLDEWGFSERLGGRGRGVSALFSGQSGTGKTMAAEVIASSLDLRMMLIDLSQIISKFIGETSKNIAAAFHQAERTGAVMVWNEGDAIWGARGAVGNATDRHVNAEVGDLLQRIEAFRGFTIVTTNMRHSIDPAFLRRFRFAIEFPMPSEDERLRLWKQAFPQSAPIKSLDWSVLARLPLSGGSIRNIALGSAFQAAERGSPIDKHLVESELAEELRKQDRPVTALDWGTMG